MHKEIDMKNILEFQEAYNNNAHNANIEHRIQTFGLMKSSIEEERKKEFQFRFNIEVPEMKIYHQMDSHQCNVYAFLRVVKDIMRTYNNVDVDHLDLSANYINFFDKLEKANALYNVFIDCKHLSLEFINSKTNQYIGSFGTFHFCKEIVNKYGLVTSDVMKEVDCNYNDNLMIELLKDKIKVDALCLMTIKSKEARYVKKKELMYEVFQFLSRVYGKPPMHFDWNGNLITPVEFKETYLKNYLDDFITVTSFDKETLLQSYAFIPNLYLGNTENLISLSDHQIKEALMKQLQDGISVWFSSEESTTLDYTENILDDQLYNFGALFNIKEISKEQKLLLDIVNYDHVMCITGAFVENGEIKQFKVDNSFGSHGRYQGRLIMTNSFFENCVITVILNKKYLDF